jgi:DNA-binding CsgD family transcriptional regulator
MEFKKEALVEREVEIAAYLLQDCSLKSMSEKTGLSKKILTAHIRNMTKKLKAEDTAGLIKMLRSLDT